MRIAQLALAGSLAALVAMASPALAKSSERQKADNKSTAEPVCQAYQQAPDGTWAQLPCGQSGSAAAGSTQHRTTPKDADEDVH